MSAPRVVLHLADIAMGDGRDEELSGWLSESERARSKRFARPDRAARYVRAHGVLREILAGRLATQPQSLRFERSPGGRPELVGERRCRFSLSHCADRALVAVTDDVAVGVDVERRRKMSERLISRVLPPWHPVPSGPEALQQLGLEIWTCTEAALKSCGLGIWGIGALALLSHPQEGAYRFELMAPCRKSGVVIGLVLDPEHRGAVAVPGDDVPQYQFAL